MLISHPCRFIYIKTLKTAGTSVEVYFEPFCVDPKQRSGDVHNRAAEVSDWGVVGSRGSADGVWYNHMPAMRIRELVGAKWDEYFKFCVVRNPFDKAVSYFWHKLPDDLREPLWQADFSNVRDMFDTWTALNRFPIDSQIYTIDGNVAVDRCLRYENLNDELKDVCKRLTIPWQPARLGRYKQEYRKRPEHFMDYYSPASTERIRNAFAWDLEYFGY